MEVQPVLRRPPRFPRQRVVVINAAQGLQHIPALLGKVLGYFHKLPSSMRQTVRHQDLHSRRQLRHVPRQSIAHLNQRTQRLAPLLQHIRDVLARMLAPGEVQSDLLTLPRRHDPAGEHPRALVIRLSL